MLSFIKMHGAGNDYVYLDGFSSAIPSDVGEFSRQISDRHTGIGSDGLVLMLPSDVAGTTARMRMFNADGSEGSLCGNALRCMAMWLHQTERCGSTCRIQMGDRVVDAEVLSSNRQAGSAIVRMAVGRPLVLSGADAMGALQFSSSFARVVELNDVRLPKRTRPVVEVSMGNSHTVLFVESLSSCDVHLTGAAIELHREFPNRTNVEFVEVTGDTAATVRVWERGSGETRACGSGACAVVVAGTILDVFPRLQPVRVQMPGGVLFVRWREDSVVELEGPAQVSFYGQWPT